MTTLITKPGIYPELSDGYHSGGYECPTRPLSQTGIKILLNETPADFMAPRKPSTRAMDLGSVTHALALGKGAKFSISPFDDYRTKDARQWRDDTIAEGLIPIKASEYADAKAMADIIKAKINHALGGADYQTEVPFFWQEGDTWACGMLDVWCEEKLVAIDPKITKIIGKRARAHMVNIGWDIQSAWYRRGLDAIFPQYAGRIRFANLLIKPDAPYTHRLLTINEAWRQSAEMECERALRIFQECMATNNWPGYPDEIEVLDAPSWTLKERIEAGMMEDDE